MGGTTGGLQEHTTPYTPWQDCVTEWSFRHVDGGVPMSRFNSLCHTRYVIERELRRYNNTQGDHLNRRAISVRRSPSRNVRNRELTLREH